LQVGGVVEDVVEGLVEVVDDGNLTTSSTFGPLSSARLDL